MLAAVEAGLAVVEYTPAEIKRAVVGYGRAEKQQVAEMVRVLLHLDVAPTPFDASDALAVAICHVHAIGRRRGASRRRAAPAAKLAAMASPGRLTALMIAQLRGRVLEKHPTRVIVETAGVGYELHVPLSSFSAIGDAGIRRRAARAHARARGRAFSSSGSRRRSSSRCSIGLIAVSGIGPRLALSLLSGIAPTELVQAVAASDVARLVSIPGIGKKTAERIVLELKDKLGGIEPSGASAADGARADLVSALVNLGYHRPAAEKAVDQAMKIGSAGGFEQALRTALRTLRDDDCLVPDWGQSPITLTQGRSASSFVLRLR